MLKILLKKDFPELFKIVSPSFSSDGVRVVFSASLLDGFEDIYIYHIKEDSLERLTHSGWEKKEPIFWRNDKSIAFTSVFPSETSIIPSTF